jgi:hypothetical protein
MRRRFAPYLIAVFLLATAPIAAVSIPVLEGDVQGLELCPQSICGAAIFVGEFDGELNGLPRQGIVLTAINHEDLPPNTGDVSLVTGGTWIIKLPFRTFAGAIIPGGTLTKNQGETFTVDVDLAILKGGSGTLSFTGTLSHEVFPPSLIGTVSQ